MLGVGIGGSAEKAMLLAKKSLMDPIDMLLSGKLLTGRDAAHKRICALLEAGKPLPDGLDFRDRVIYYVGPVDPVGAEVVGPARRDLVS